MSVDADGASTSTGLMTCQPGPCARSFTLKSGMSRDSHPGSHEIGHLRVSYALYAGVERLDADRSGLILTWTPPALTVRFAAKDGRT